MDENNLPAAYVGLVSRANNIKTQQILWGRVLNSPLW
jgi:hypothetical protein